MKEYILDNIIENLQDQILDIDIRIRQLENKHDPYKECLISQKDAFVEALNWLLGAWQEEIKED